MVPELPPALHERLHYHAHADGKGDYFRLHQHRFAAVLAALRPPTGDVLEIGTTPGQFTRLLVETGYTVQGVDLDPSTRQALWRQLGVTVKQANIEQESLPYGGEQFDTVVFSEVIEHLVYSPLPVLRDIYRVLRPTGQVVISTPNELYVKSRLTQLGRMLRWQSSQTTAEFQRQMQLEGTARYTTHSRTYTMDELCWLVQAAGFQVVRRQYVAAWEPVGIELGRIRTQPLQVLGKGATTSFTAALAPARSMLLVVGER